MWKLIPLMCSHMYNTFEQALKMEVRYINYGTKRKYSIVVIHIRLLTLTLCCYIHSEQTVYRPNCLVYTQFYIIWSDRNSE